MDRRQHDRWCLDCAATALCLGGDQFGRMHDLRTIDMGHGGMSAVGRDAIEPGTPVCLGFASQDQTARHGVVVASDARDGTQRLSIRFTGGLAA